MPLDTLFRENTNCPSAARSAGTVGKWGITSFTSIRSAPYAFTNNFIKKPVQDQNSPLTVPALEPELPPPKPKKFFKSRNAPDAGGSSPAQPSSTPALRSVSPEPASFPSYNKKEEKVTRQINTHVKKSSKVKSPAAIRDPSPEKLEIPKLKIHVDKLPKGGKHKIASKGAKKEEPAEKTHLSPNKRYLVRNRDKVINYAEDRSNSPPIPESLITSTRSPSPPKAILTPKSSPTVTSPTYVKPGILSPTNKDGKPPIVLRISKGTSRLVSTDSEDVLTSPNSDRHSMPDVHMDNMLDKASEPIVSPKHESLKITIKCYNKDGKKKEKVFKSESTEWVLNNTTSSKEAAPVSSRATRSSKRTHQKDVNSDDVPLSRQVSSPLPGTENYELYRALSSPAQGEASERVSDEQGMETVKETSNKYEDVETQLARLDSLDGNDVDTNITNEPVPEPKPPEIITGRTMRHRANINYNENAFDEANLQKATRNSTKSGTKKSKKKTDSVHATDSEDMGGSQSDNELLDILTEKSELLQVRPAVNYPEREDIIPPLRLNKNLIKFSKKSRKKSEALAQQAVNESDVQMNESDEPEESQVNDNLLQILSDDTEGPCHLAQAKSNTENDSDEVTSSRTTRASRSYSKRKKKIENLPPDSQGDSSECNMDDLPLSTVQNDVVMKEDTSDLDQISEHLKVRPSRNATKSYSKKSKRKNESTKVPASNNVQSDDNDPNLAENESQSDNESLIRVLSDTSDPCDSLKIKISNQQIVQTKDNFNSDHEMDDIVKSPRSSVVSEIKSREKNLFKSPKRICDSGNDSDDKPSVKLVITKKKGSIFKSRSLVNEEKSLPTGARKRTFALYTHKWADDGKGNQTPRREPEPLVTPYDARPDSTEDVADEPIGAELERVTKYRNVENRIQDIPGLEDEPTESYTSVRCPKGAKDFYTVVRNVKKAHQMQEIGEFQDINDDVEYILDALQDNNPMSTRCLSAITLAMKCTVPAFRMHVRAHGTVQKFFRALHDATNDQSLGLCTATVMFVLSQDRLNMDLDRESLELMLNLLESDVSHRNALDDCGLTSAQLAKNKEKVRELCAEIKSQGKAKHLDLDNITVGHLAMETLLSLTSKRAGEWFKEELRSLGGIEHIVRTVQDCCAVLGCDQDTPVQWTPQTLDTLRKADRCMRVLENVTQQNEENQLYLLSNGSQGLAPTLAALLPMCCREARHASDASVGAAVRETILPAIKVLINLSHSFGMQTTGASIVGEQIAVMETSLRLLLNGDSFIPEEKNFEFSVCILLLLINLVQNNPDNIERLLSLKVNVSNSEDVMDITKPALQALIDHFYKRQELARLAEQKTDAILDGEKEKEDEEAKKKKNKSHDEFIEETVAKLLEKAGTHMEHTMIASYIVLLVGNVARASPEHEQTVRSRLPSASFADMRVLLAKYYSFLNLTASAEAASVAHVKATQKIIDYLEASDKAHSETPAADSSKERPPSPAAPQSPPSSRDTFLTTNEDTIKTSACDMDIDTSFN